MSTYLAWVEEKSGLAHALENGNCGGTVADGVIVLCTCICAMASFLWVETENTDRKRFVEILTRFSPDTKKISVPLLAQKDDSWGQRLRVSQKTIRYTEANDQTESEVLSLCDSSQHQECKKIIRRYSYANILYQDVRSGFAHTYLPSDRVNSVDQLTGIFSRDGSEVSYVNRLAQTSMRQIHFPLERIAVIAKNVARGMDAECTQSSKYIAENIGLIPPVSWWIEGA